MTVRKAAQIFVVSIAALVAIIAIGLNTLPPEYFGKTGLLATRYRTAIVWALYVAYGVPLLILMAAMIKAGLHFSLKKATLIFILLAAFLWLAIPFARSILPPEYLAKTGLKAALYQLTGYTLMFLMILVPLSIFMDVLLKTGSDKKTKNLQGMFDLRIKAGPRWFIALIGGIVSVALIYVCFTARVDIGDDNVALSLVFLFALIAFFGWLGWWSAFIALLRVRYDNTRIIATTSLFRQREHKWADLLKIKNAYFSEGKRLIFRNTGTAHIEEYLEGYGDLMEHAEKVLGDA